VKHTASLRSALERVLEDFVARPSKLRLPHPVLAFFGHIEKCDVRGNGEMRVRGNQLLASLRTFNITLRE
jgi:hypothetical protein